MVLIVWVIGTVILQFEDCVDVFKVLYPEYDVLFLFDHSADHDKMKPDGLTVSGMGKFWSGTQPRMRSMKLINNSFFGDYPNLGIRLSVGDEQHIQFPVNQNSSGPYCLKNEDKESKQHSRLEPIEPEKIVKYTKKQLVNKLADKNVDIDCDRLNINDVRAIAISNDIAVEYTKDNTICCFNKEKLQDMLNEKNIDSKGNKDTLVDRCKNNGIPTTYTVTEKTVEGFEGSPIDYQLNNVNRGNLPFLLTGKNEQTLAYSTLSTTIGVSAMTRTMDMDTVGKYLYTRKHRDAWADYCKELTKCAKMTGIKGFTYEGSIYNAIDF